MDLESSVRVPNNAGVERSLHGLAPKVCGDTASIANAREMTQSRRRERLKAHVEQSIEIRMSSRLLAHELGGPITLIKSLRSIFLAIFASSYPVLVYICRQIYDHEKQAV